MNSPAKTEYNRIYRETHRKAISDHAKLVRSQNYESVLEKERKRQNLPEYREYQKRYREAHKDKSKLYHAKRYASNKEAWNIRTTKYYKNNKARILAAHKANYNLHKERFLQKHKLYRLKNAELLVQKAKEYAKKNPERIRIYRKTFQDKHKLEASLKLKAKRAKMKGCTVDERGVNQFYKNARNQKWVSCYWCQTLIKGEDCHIDHVIPIAKGGRHAVDNLCTSCCDCNQRKAAKLPHQFNKLPQMFLSV